MSMSIVIWKLMSDNLVPLLILKTELNCWCHLWDKALCAWL